METKSDLEQQSKKIKPTQHNQFSTTPIPTLPSEVITEILSRLPVKSLLKFRCVSKSWCSLISGQQFIKTHLKFSMKDPDFTDHRIIFTISYPRFNLKHCSLRSLLDEPLTDAPTISYPGKNPRRAVWVVGSCNGLICIAINEKDLFLWNPSVRKSNKLPDVDVQMGRGFYIIYGFGFDGVNDDYKVVGIFGAFGNAGRYETMVKVYSLRANSWKRIGDFKGGVPLDDSGKFAHGKLHWSVSPGLGFSSKWDIVSLDVGRETYGMLEQPDYGEGGFDSILGVLGGNICVLCNYQKTRADVWVLKEYGVKESWYKLVTIPYVDDPGKHRYSIPLCMLPNGEVLLVLGLSFLVYNPKECTFRFPEFSNLKEFLEADIYIESLLSPADHCGSGRAN